jgi:hypothetical protein
MEASLVTGDEAAEVVAAGELDQSGRAGVAGHTSG